MLVLCFFSKISNFYWRKFSRFIAGSGLAKKKEQGAVFNGKISLPKDWLQGQEVSLDGSLLQKNNNDLFSGVDFRHRNR